MIEPFKGNICVKGWLLNVARSLVGATHQSDSDKATAIENQDEYWPVDY